MSNLTSETNAYLFYRDFHLDNPVSSTNFHYHTTGRTPNLKMSSTIPFVWKVFSKKIQISSTSKFQLHFF
uniref:Ovule protein n=1 Tax=Mesocestoides corti TaxID=53468 RepID=A0A5K3FHR2_MESCO